MHGVCSILSCIIEAIPPAGTVLSFAIDIEFEDVEFMIPSFQLSEGLRIIVLVNRNIALATLLIHRYCSMAYPAVREYA